MDLFLKISVPQTNFCRLGDLEKNNMSLSRHTEFCKADFWKESVAGK